MLQLLCFCTQGEVSLLLTKSVVPQRNTVMTAPISRHLASSFVECYLLAIFHAFLIMKLRNSFFCGFSIFHGSGFQTQKLSAKPSGSQMMASYLYLNDVLIITCTAALAFTSVTQIPFFVTQLCTSSNAVISVSSFSLRHFLLQKTQHSGCRGAELVPPSLIDCSFPLSCSSIFIREGF